MALSVPLSRFTSLVGGGSAFFVRHHMRPSKPFQVTMAAIVVIVLGIYFSIPRARYTSGAAGCINRLRNIESAKEEWALEHSKTTNDVPTWADLYPYFSSTFTNIWFTNGMPVCPSGGIYTIGRVGVLPTCSLAVKYPYQHTMP